MTTRDADAVDGLVEAIAEFARGDVMGLVIVAGQRFRANDPFVVARPGRFIPAGLEGEARDVAVREARAARLAGVKAARITMRAALEETRRRRLERMAQRRSRPTT